MKAKSKVIKGVTMVDPLKYWGKHYDATAKREGWSLWDADGVICIQRIDEQGSHLTTDAEVENYLKTHVQLNTDSQAINLIAEKALKGSVMHALALYLEGCPVDDDVDLPVPFKIKK